MNLLFDRKEQGRQRTVDTVSTRSETSNGRRWPTAIDLYCGSGSVTAALKAAHFRVVAAVDNDKTACETFRTNHRRTPLYERDIKDVDPMEIRRVNLDDTDLDLLVVCAPCQPFSSQNKNRDEADDRTKLILEAVRFAAVLKPKLIFFENVAGLVSPGFSSLLERLESNLRELGYSLGSPERVDAAIFGVPQRRIRCVMVATNTSTPPIFDVESLKKPRQTVRDAIGSLPSLSSGESDSDDPLHKARAHSELALLRLAHIPKDGGDRFSLPTDLELPCHKDFKGHPDVYGRMAWDDVAPTLTTGCTDITRGRFAHPRDDRAITLREAALLQTFPERYRFAGNSGQIARQIGNAVPFLMAKELAREFRRILNESRPA